jgi:hypothetical protein
VWVNAADPVRQVGERSARRMEGALQVELDVAQQR